MDEQKLIARARRGWNALRKDIERYGTIDDGAGKRMRIGVDFVCAGKPERALEFYTWRDDLLPDQIDEPLDALAHCLALLRTGDPDRVGSAAQGKQKAPGANGLDGRMADSRANRPGHPSPASGLQQAFDPAPALTLLLEGACSRTGRAIPLSARVRRAIASRGPGFAFGAPG
ncbi:hypothetical protein HFP89_11930 [Wenzhouxiangella sp. XN79A]|uniref:hypothetical protein n=1 Tax=Wenzhouxiangella sp. XN79A TaxID=2724193 RepID=UPI00144ABA40|nr:hypothetical protein [Wenzhouxiangella sp. XN79A]NKI35872.1 hypothetical protein [Wenzhouxiangella sp. XN79A]